METQQNSQTARKRRFLLILPVIIIPFATVIFWALGGGAAEPNSQVNNTKTGFNKILPGANLKDESNLDKLSYYDQAMQDSAKRAELIKHDPSYQQITSPGILPSSFGSAGDNGQTQPSVSPYAGAAYNDPNEARIYQRLNQLNQAINQSPKQLEDQQSPTYPSTTPLAEKDVNRLEQLMRQMPNNNGGSDPEIDQLNGMLEKILDIQNPERAQEKLRQNSEASRGKVFSVTAAKKKEIYSLLEPAKANVAGTPQKLQDAGNGFYSSDELDSDNTDQNAVEAVVHETQTLVNGSTVKLRLLNDIYINGILIPKENFVFGTATLDGERLVIQIAGIRYKKSVYPVKLAVVDIDGIDGIYIPGAISRDVAKQSADRAIQDLSFGTMSNSIGIQAAGTGLEAAKSLFSKKVKLVKVTVKAGYRILLRDEKQKQDN